MKKTAIISTFLAIAIFILPNNQSNAQSTKVLGKVASFVGQTIASSAIETVVGKSIENMFYSSNNTNPGTSNSVYTKPNNYPVEVMVMNDIPYTYTYFWVTIDGNYWYPYVLGPGEYFVIQAGIAGKVGIFNGYDVNIINRSGQYFSSQFF